MEANIDDYKCPKCGSFLRVQHTGYGWFCTLCGIEFKPRELKANSLSS